MRSERVIDPELSPKHRDSEDALTALSFLLRDDLAACDRAILARTASPVALIPLVAAHVVAAGGKRLRPMLTLAAARLCGYAPARCDGHAASDAGTMRGFAKHVELAACIELIHTATLLHDDVVDESLLRRGRQSANARFGEKPPVLVGDFLFARAFQIMVEQGSPRVLSILSAAAATMASGEVLQLTTENDLATSDATYLDVVKGKTSALFGAACQVGAVVAGREDAEPALSEYGLNLGTAFQLVDDALDYAADEATLGKAVGDDFREGKVTLPVLIAYRRGCAWERAFWERTIVRAEQRGGDLATAIGLLRQRGAIGGTMARAGVYARQARAALAGFDATPVRHVLGRVADFAARRTH